MEGGGGWGGGARGGPGRRRRGGGAHHAGGACRLVGALGAARGRHAQPALDGRSAPRFGRWLPVLVLKLVSIVIFALSVLYPAETLEISLRFPADVARIGRYVCVLPLISLLAAAPRASSSASPTAAGPEAKRA